MLELVLYGIRLLAKQFLGTFLDIKVDHSDKAFLISKSRGNGNSYLYKEKSNKKASPDKVLS